LKKLLLLLSITLITSLSASNIYIKSNAALNIELLSQKKPELVDNSFDVVKENKDKDKDEEIYLDKDFFIGLSVGISMYEVSETDVVGSVTLDSHPKDAGSAFGVELGYYFSDAIFATLDYQRTDLKDAHFDNMFTSLNYQFKELDILSPYIGGIAGYNIMNWDVFPISQSISHPSSSSFFTGAQIGSDISIRSDLDFYIFYRYLWIDNKTIILISPDKKEITHENEQNLNVGVKFKF